MRKFTPAASMAGRNRCSVDRNIADMQCKRAYRFNLLLLAQLHMRGPVMLTVLRKPRNPDLASATQHHLRTGMLQVELAPFEDPDGYALLSPQGLDLLRKLDPSLDKLVISGDTLSTLTEMLETVLLLIGSDLPPASALLRLRAAAGSAQQITDSFAANT